MKSTLAGRRDPKRVWLCTCHLRCFAIPLLALALPAQGVNAPLVLGDRHNLYEISGINLRCDVILDFMTALMLGAEPITYVAKIIEYIICRDDGLVSQTKG